MTNVVSGRIELGSLDWVADVQVSNVSTEMARHLRDRWEGLSSSSPTDRKVEVVIELEATDEAVGLPLTPLVEVRLTWRDRRHAKLVASSLEAEIEVVGDTLEVRGRAEASHARGALESAFRAVAALTLARRHVLVVHASAVASAAGAVLFLGPSEAGKTTTARRLGQEGWKRLADDMIAVDLSRAEPRLHLLPFERSGKWSPASRTAFEAPICLAAGIVAKGRAASVEPAPAAVQAWAAARLTLACPPGEQEAALDDFAALCRIPAFDLGVPRAGRLDGLIQEVIRRAPTKRLDGPEGGGHSAAALADIPTFSGPFDETCVLSRAPNVAWRVLDGSAVLVAPSSPLVHTLNSVGTFVWELADQGRVSTIVEAVVNEFAVSRTQALADVERFVADLAEKQLLVVSRAK